MKGKNRFIFMHSSDWYTKIEAWEEKWNNSAVKLQMKQWTEVLFIVMFALTTAFDFLVTVNIKVNWLSLFGVDTVLNYMVVYLLVRPQTVLLILVLFRYFLELPRKWKEFLFVIVLYWIVKRSCDVSGETRLLKYILLIMGARDISFHKLVKVFWGVSMALFCGTVLSSQVGLIENLIYTQRGIRIAFGFTYVTGFAAHVFFLWLFYWYLRGDRLTYIEAILSALSGCFVFVYSGARCSAILLWLLSIIMVYHRIRIRHGIKTGKPYQMNSIWSGILSMSVTLCAILVHVLSIFYTKNIVWMQKLDELLSSRLFLVKRAIDIYGFRLWGADIPQTGNSRSVITPEKYFYIDSSYMRFSLQYGLIVFVILLCVFWVIGNRIREEKAWVLLWAFALMAIHGLIEQRILWLAYCPMMLAAFSDIKRCDVYRSKRRKK